MAVTDLVADLRLGTSNLRGDISRAKSLFAGLASGGLSNLRVFGALGGAIGSAVSQFASADQAARGLRAALAATGNEVEGNYARMNDFADSMRNSTVYGKSLIQQLQAMALNMGVSAAQTDKVVQAGIGLGEAVMGGDIKRGVRAASLAIQGNYGELGELIPRLRQATSEYAKLKIVNQVAAQGWDLAKAKSSTFSGSLAALSRSSKEAGAALGEVFAADIQKLAGALVVVTEKIGGMSSEMDKAKGFIDRLETAVIAHYFEAVSASSVKMMKDGTAKAQVNALDLWKQYLQDTEQAAKQASDRLAEDAKKNADKQAELTREGVRKQKVYLGDLVGYHRKLQETILQDDIQAGEKQSQAAVAKNAREAKANADAKKKAKGPATQPVGPVGGGAEPDNPNSEANFGQPTPDVMAKANARRVADAKKEIIRIEKALERIGPKGDPTLKRTLESAYEAAKATIRRGGEPNWYRPNSADELLDTTVREKDRREQTGLPERSDRVNDALEKYERGKGDKDYRQHIETPAEQMRRGLGGADPKALGDAAEALKTGADKLNKLRVVGVVKD